MSPLTQLPAVMMFNTAPDGFLAYESSIPRALLDGAGPRTGKMDINNTIGHFELVNYQLKEVRSGTAAAG